MKKLKEKLTSRSSSRRPRNPDATQHGSTSSNLTPSRLTDNSFSGFSKAVSKRGIAPEQSHSRPENIIGPIRTAGHASAHDEVRDQTTSPVDDGIHPSLPPPEFPTGAAKDNKTDSVLIDPLPALSFSPLWRKAMDLVKANDDWIRYRDIVAKNVALSGDETDSPEDIIAIAKRLSDQLEKSKTSLKLAGRTIVIRDVLNKVLDALSMIKDVGASLTSLNPYASLAWGGLQFFVQAAVNNKEIAALCWDELPRMVRLMSQYQTFENLYDISKLEKSKIHLEDALVRLFSAILRYQVVIVKYASSRTDRFKAAFQDKLESVPQQVFDEIKLCEDEVTRLQSFANREITDAHFQYLTDASDANSQRWEKILADLRQSNLKAQKFSSITAAYLESQSTSLETTRKHAILEWISTAAYGDVHNRRDRRAMEGTGKWLLQRPEYIRWRSSKQTAVLWLHGTMGSGKSCLAHKVIEDIRTSSSRFIIQKFAYFYCDGSSEQGRRDIENADNILRCLLKQLSRVGQEDRLMASIIEIYNRIHPEGHLSDDQCETLIKTLVDESEMTTIVIDGLDECSEAVQNQLLTNISDLLEGCLSSLKIFLSSRHNENIIDLLQDLPVTEIELGDKNAEDIEMFVRRTAKDASSNPGNERRYAKSGHSQEKAVVDRILAKAGGMFRWVQMAFDFLHASIDYDAMTERLDHLSHLGKLFDLYDRIYDEMMDRVDKADQARIRTLLMFMLHGGETPRGPRLRYRDPVDIDDIAHVLEACEFSATANPFKAPMSVERVGSLCPSLVIITITEDNCHNLTFPHVSVREWLLTGPKGSGIYKTLPGHNFLSQLCMNAISASGERSKIILGRANIKNIDPTYPKMTAWLQYSSHGWLDHLTCIGARNWSLYINDDTPSQDISIQTALESFLFNLHKQATVCTEDLVTGFQLWHQLCKHQGRTLYGENNDDEAVCLYEYNEGGMLPKILRKYMNMPAAMLTPAFICALVSHDCDLSSVQEAAMGVGSDGQDWRVRTLATAMVNDDADAIKWLVQQIRPSPEDLADALLLNVYLGLWPGFDDPGAKVREQAPRPGVWLSQLLRLLVAFGLDPNGRCGPSGTSLLIRLILAWVRSKHSNHRMVSIMVACLIFSGADALVRVEIPTNVRVGSWKPFRLDGERLEISEFTTVFDWILLWGRVPEISGVEDYFLMQQWEKSVWTRWLKLAVCDPQCSPNLVQSCLKNGEYSLLPGEERQLLLRSAIDRGCNGAVLDILSIAAFAADVDLRAYDVLRGGDLANIIEKCSKSTIKLWNDNGADIAGIDLNKMQWSQDAPLDVAKRRTRITGDSSAEEYLRSLGISTPKTALSVSRSLINMSKQYSLSEDSEGDVQSERAFSDDANSSRAIQVQRSIGDR